MNLEAQPGADVTAQQRCLRGVAARLEPDGCLVIEANVFDADIPTPIVMSSSDPAPA